MSCTERGILVSKPFRFEWKINPFFSDCNNIGDFYKSPTFSVVTHDNQIIKWYMTTNPKGIRNEHRDYVSLYLHLDGNIRITVLYELSIISVKNSLSTRRKATKTFQSSASVMGWPEFIEQNFIKDNSLIDDTVTIFCELTLDPTVHDVIDSPGYYAEWLDKIGNGFDDYEDLLESGNFADMTLNVQDKKINSHKAILSCRSPVFKAMFEHEMRERNQNSVDITDIDFDVMKEFIRFVYSRKVNDIGKIAGELLYAANKYQVVELKALCEKTLYDKLTVYNAIECLKLAEMCDTIHLKRLVTQFVVAHRKAIVNKPGFADLNSNLMYQIIQGIVEKE